MDLYRRTVAALQEARLPAEFDRELLDPVRTDVLPLFHYRYPVGPWGGSCQER
jgi:hypothetical protein